MAFVAGLACTALLILLGHWFPWPVKLHRLAAYTYGCLCILSGAGVWLLSRGEWRDWLSLAAFVGVAGAATGLAYLVDAALRGRVQRQVHDGRDN